jgi:4-amino-4-deoxy-L-arabinose transferase-like glycosyltransferase
VLFGALVVTGAAMAWNLQGFPGRANDDEGTYVARAWAMIAQHHLANYTYFWDHPFLGWATIAAWALATDGFSRDLRAVMAGRELMWATTLVAAALVYALSRRLVMNRFFAVTAVLLFGLSPLAIWYHRMVSLDNLATMWALAAFALAASHRRSLASIVWSGACFAAATWSKETIAIIVPALLWQVGQHLGGDGAGRGYSVRRKYIRAFLVVYCGIVGLYPLMAVIKGELLPGAGHVSLLGEIYYQLAGRSSTGSLLDPRSGTCQQAAQWVATDPWLTLGALAALAAAFAVRRYRPVALALLVQVLYMVKGGYVPYAYVTALLPFAAVLIAGTLDWLWSRRAAWFRLPVLAAAVACAALMLPAWGRSLVAQSRANGFAAQDAAVAWIGRHLTQGQVVVCDDYVWPDLRLRTRTTPVYLWTIDYDPAVMRDYLPDGYRDIRYLVLDPSSPLTYTALPGRPTLAAALRHATVIATFGSIDVYQVTR